MYGKGGGGTRSLAETAESETGERESERGEGGEKGRWAARGEGVRRGDH